MKDAIAAAVKAAAFGLPLYSQEKIAYDAGEMARFRFDLRHRQPWVSVKLPDQARGDLVKAVFDHLGRYTNPESGELGFAPAETMTASFSIVGSRTVDRFAESMVTAAAILGEDGPELVSSKVAGWAQGEPLRLVQKRTLCGVDIPEPVELRRGVRFETLPRLRFEDIIEEARYARDTIRVSSMPALLIEATVQPVFFVPHSLEDQAKFLPPPFTLTGPFNSSREAESLMAALSLACNSAVYEVQRWNDPGTISRLLLGGSYGDGAPVTYLRVPMHDPHPQSRQRRLTPGRLQAVMRILDGLVRRNHLDIAIDRWINSMYSEDLANGVIDLRTVMESLYASPGAEGELSLRCSTRGAVHLARDAADRRKHFDQFRALYRVASALVHRGQVPKEFRNDQERLRGLTFWSKKTLRRAILKRLGEGPMEEKDWNDLVLGAGGPPN